MHTVTTGTISHANTKTLAKNTRSPSVSVRLSERSHIVLLSATGPENRVIAQSLTPPNKVGKGGNRFFEGGLTTIGKDKPRGDNHGRYDTKKQARLRKKIIETTMQAKPSNATHWSTWTLTNTTYDARLLFVLYGNRLV